MWISRKRLEALEKRVADLEKNIQSQPSFDTKKFVDQLRKISHFQAQVNRHSLARQLPPEQNG